VLDSVHLNQSEIQLFTQHFRKAQNSLIRERAQALLAFNQGVSPYQLSIVLRRSEKTIREWIKAFHKGRIASLFPRYRTDNAAKLSRKQKQEIAAVLLKEPSDYGIPFAFWDVSALKSYIKAEFGVEYGSDESYRLIFKLHNYSFHLPGTFDRHRDDGKVESRVAEIRQEIQPYLEDSRNWLVFASDECRIIWEAVIRRLWLPRGQKSIIKVERKRKAQSFIGFLNLNSGEELLFPLSWQKQATIIPVLEELTQKYPGKKICIIWDNARFHKGKLLRGKLSTILRNIHLINLPAYAPDHNPQEHVWKYGKDKIANVQCETLEEVVTKFSTIVMGRNYPYHF
jgi:transposase